MTSNFFKRFVPNMLWANEEDDPTSDLRFRSPGSGTDDFRELTEKMNAGTATEEEERAWWRVVVDKEG